MSDTKLKQCPFCGGEADIEDIGENENDHYYMITCKNSACSGSFCFGQRTKEDLIKAYNRRKPMERIVEQLEEVRKDRLENAKRYVTIGNFAEAEIYSELASEYTNAIKIVKKGGAK